MSSYGYSEPLHDMNKMDLILEYSNFCLNPEFYNKNYNLILTLPPWHHNIHIKNKNIISCYVTESTELIPNQKEFLMCCRDIWVPTNFCKNVLLQNGIESKLLPYSIPLPTKKRIEESSGDFTFLVSFDGKYSYVKKGVIETIQAFKIAFENISNVKLVLKTFELQFYTKKIISEFISGDNRIVLKENKLQNFEDLYDNVSCYVSFHKGEGFGRHIAESMLRELLVVTNFYSGPIDFCNDENCILNKEGSLIEHKKQCNFYSFNGSWFQPSVESCAQALLKAYSLSTEEKNKLTKKAKAIIVEKYSKQRIINLIQDYIQI